MEQHRPLGYWLKVLDQLIEEHLNRALAAEGIHRRQWQTMNLLRSQSDWDGPATKEAIAAKLRPFWSGSAVTVAQVLDELVRRGWITGREPYGLTPAGEAAHAALAQTVERAGRQLRAGVTTQQYADTVEVLRHMVANARRLTFRGAALSDCRDELTLAGFAGKGGPHERSTGHRGPRRDRGAAWRARRRGQHGRL